MNPLARTSLAHSSPGMLRLAVSGALLLTLAGASARGQSRVESFERPDGTRVVGRLAGDGRTGFGFVSSQSSVPIALDSGSTIHFNGPGPTSLISVPPFRVLIGQSLRLTGSLYGITAQSVRLGLSWQAGEVTIPRPGVQAIIQRRGESRVLVDGFETLDRAHWTVSGKPEIVTKPQLADKHSVRLPAGTTLLYNVSEPMATGRFDIAFHDDGAVVAGQHWSIELTFQGPSGLSVVRVALGWSEESLAVESPSGLAVQRLARTPGWHRFSLRFGPTQTEASVDGKELAHGKGPDGPLVSIRLVCSSPPGQSASAKSPAGYFDDLQLIRFAEPPASLELDITQDEARLVVGDQLFGTIKEANNERISMIVDKEPATLPWSDVAGVYFKRAAATSAPVEGPLVRVEWRSAPDDDPENIDFAEGALSAVSDQAVTLTTPFAGALAIPVPLLRKLVVQGEGRRIIIDPSAHHLGDEFSTTMPLDPPQPEGGVLERTFDLPTVPGGDCFVVLDLVQLVGENSDPHYSQQIRDGELRTYVAINSKRIDYLNHYLKTNNLVPERIAIPVPATALHPGKNSIRLELTGMATNEKQLDDFGLLQLAIEFRSKGRPVSQPPHEPGHP